ncbi:MAG: SDR family NAD(P)-dependent oxidoreductase [Planctomycetes bacterium]|nr:SDR family NAD(P)-dependent oxidoreductase [Planctomycetota bacterium]
MPVRSLAGARVVLTGASSGIGSALAAELSRAGARLLLTARREERLQRIAREIDRPAEPVAYVSGDIREPRTRQQIYDDIERRWGSFDVLINNAGVGAVGPFARASAGRLREIMETNFFAPVELTRLLLPALRQGQTPLIVNVSSVLGHRAMPNKSEYCASKFALHGFSDALRAELAREAIHVMLVSPSTTESDFFEHLLEADSATRVRRGRPMPAATVARIIRRGMRRNVDELILTWSGTGLVWLDRLFPRLANLLAARFGQ